MRFRCLGKRWLQQEKKDNMMSFIKLTKREGRRTIVINAKDITYIEEEDGFCVIRLQSIAKEFKVEESLQTILDFINYVGVTRTPS